MQPGPLSYMSSHDVGLTVGTPVGEEDGLAGVVVDGSCVGCGVGLRVGYAVGFGVVHIRPTNPGASRSAV